MHEFGMKIMECVKTKVEAMGIDNIEGQHLDELKEWVCIARDITEFDYYYNIIKAMEESEYGEDYDYKGRKPYSENHRSVSPRHYQEPMIYDPRINEMRNGKMHYTEPMHDASESRYDRTRRMYTETKAMTPHDKTERLAKINKHLDAVEDDMMELKDDMTPEERTTTKQRFVNMSNKM